MPVISVVLRHIAGDWGIVSDDDKQQNDLSIDAGLRLLSIYCLPDHARILVVIEWDRSTTIVERIGDTAPNNGTRRETDDAPYPAWPVVRYLQGACT